MKTLSYVNFIISILFMACYAYQAVYLAAALLKKQKVFKAKKLHRYGVLIAAQRGSRHCAAHPQCARTEVSRGAYRYFCRSG